MESTQMPRRHGSFAAPRIRSLIAFALLLAACGEHGSRRRIAMADRAAASDSARAVNRALGELHRRGFDSPAGSLVVRCFARWPWGVVIAFARDLPDSIFSHSGAVVSVMRDGTVRFHTPVDSSTFSTLELHPSEKPESLINESGLDSSTVVMWLANSAMHRVVLESMNVSCYERLGGGVFVVMNSSDTRGVVNGVPFIVGAVGPRGEGWVLFEE